ncbi:MULTISPECIES: helix-turn-helix domain-containing protein [unclassified Corynebacterium]|uniref:helix-turn-helix domain-containing protein n=1 Tax=unclassified Corynebacterium TaxID=2624378 RepID=UPI0021AA5CD2|nr:MULTISPECIES: helix-turn-helix domain-containing protein [unclassified Corynebacterium]MCT1452304.1 helix-turn-helix domain-containing protein [Corynebacterium sp. p3-SID1145]MCT1461300.1 helix-turn-helix domain-containing protein [Corynebacterium sp. p3-SID1140]MDN8593836.1 helix-turn-helix domain-containing protein [Corynebacterium sp. P4_F2]WKK55943.1 helix-turn-helix domain-containing protein [Corynebacterium sp. P4-C1]WKK63354.1 helix-turn-helix domain-containing protein [Corynebacteri
MTNVQDNSTTQTRATARHALRKLNSALAQRTDSTKGIDVAVEGSGEVIRLSQDVAGLLRDILANTAAGRSVSVIPTSAELTTQQAADLLNVSRPHVIKLMDDGVLEGHKVGTHRRLYASDVQAYKHQRDIKQRAAADELTALTDHLGLYE